ncbi:MAG: restriction endonuclease subunit S, partial [Chitinophagaceae bacterium]
MLIALYGATIGKLAWLGIDATTNQAVCGIFNNEDHDLRYLYLYLFHRRRKLIEAGIGGAQPNISQTILKNLKVPLPDKETQQQIVSKIEELFSELDKGIEELKTAQQQLKVYRQAILKWAFEGKLTNEDVKEGELPKGWKLVKTKDVIEIINNGYTPTKEFLSEGSGEVPFIKVYNLNFDGTLNFAKNPTFIPAAIHQKELKRSICLPGDVLINIVGPPLVKLSIVTNQYPEWNINQAIVMF